MHASSGTRTALGIVAGLLWLAIGCGGDPPVGSEPPAPSDPAQAPVAAVDPTPAPAPAVDPTPAPAPMPAQMDADGFVPGQALPEGFPELPELTGLEYYGSLAAGMGARWNTSGTPQETSEKLQAAFREAGWEISGVSEVDDGMVILAIREDVGILGALNPSPDGGTHVDLAAGPP